MKPAPSTIDIELIRSQTSGCQTLIHFNNAGASLPADVVVETMVDYLREEAKFGGYETEAKYSGQLNAVYEKVASLIGAQSDEIALFENASAAWGTAFGGLSFQPGDEILTSEMGYVTNLIGLVDAQRSEKVCVRVIPNDAQGNFSITELENLLVQGQSSSWLPTYHPQVEASYLSKRSVRSLKKTESFILWTPVRVLAKCPLT